MIDPLDTAFFDRPPQGRGPRPMLRFYTEAVPLPAKSAEEGREIVKLVDMVGITNPGSRDETPRKAEDKAREDEFIAWAYRKWKTTQEQPVTGTPLETVPWLNKAQVIELRSIGVHTLETLAEMPDTAKQRMMGASDLSKKAKTYMAAAKDGAIVTKLQDELSQRDQTITMLKKQMDDMSARFDELARKVTA